LEGRDDKTETTRKQRFVGQVGRGCGRGKGRNGSKVIRGGAPTGEKGNFPRL